MREIIFSLVISLAIIGIAKGQSQSIEGNWVWSYQNKHQTEISITTNQNQLLVNYCSIVYEGNKLDSNTESNFQFNQRSQNVYEGTIHSSFDNCEIDIRFTFNSDFTALNAEILNDPDGEFYFPDDVQFNKL